MFSWDLIFLELTSQTISLRTQYDNVLLNRPNSQFLSIDIFTVNSTIDFLLDCNLHYPSLWPLYHTVIQTTVWPLIIPLPRGWGRMSLVIIDCLRLPQRGSEMNPLPPSWNPYPLMGVVSCVKGKVSPSGVGRETHTEKIRGQKICVWMCVSLNSPTNLIDTLFIVALYYVNNLCMVPGPCKDKQM